MGHFPSFIPVPFSNGNCDTVIPCEAPIDSVTEPPCFANTAETSAASAIAVMTHSPYASLPTSTTYESACCQPCASLHQNNFDYNGEQEFVSSQAVYTNMDFDCNTANTNAFTGPYPYSHFAVNTISMYPYPGYFMPPLVPQRCTPSTNMFSSMMPLTVSQSQICSMQVPNLCNMMFNMDLRTPCW